MNNIGLRIVTVQNEDSSIKMLAAQKELYSRAKILFLIQCILAVPIPIIISIIAIAFKTRAEQFAWLFALYTIVGSLGELILDSIMSDLKKTAAAIQEKFDCNVLGIEWNDTLIPAKPQSETIFRYYTKHMLKNKLNDLYDWYSPEIRSVSTNLAAIICQRTNCTYDSSLRRKVKVRIVIITILTFLILLFISASTGITLKSFIVQVLAPSIPIFILAWKQIAANNETIENLLFLRENIETILSTANITSIVNDNSIRRIQDKIYCNRTLSNLLPNWVFKKLRKELEAEMHFTVQEKVTELNSR